MLRRALLRAALSVAVCLLVFSATIGLAASNSVQSTHVGRWSFAVDANTLKPPECAALTLARVVICPSSGGTCSGTDASELILGSPYTDEMLGGKGDDCILGAGGDDYLKGEQGTDICIGGPGVDTFHPSCETQIP